VNTSPWSAIRCFDLVRLMREFVAVMSLLICLFCSVSFAIGSCLLRLVRGAQAHVGQYTF